MISPAGATAAAAEVAAVEYSALRGDPAVQLRGEGLPVAQMSSKGGASVHVWQRETGCRGLLPGRRRHRLAGAEEGDVMARSLAAAVDSAVARTPCV